jgi:hypothetical protein
MSPVALRFDRGQATVEFLLALPLVLVAAFAAASIVAFEAAREHAGEAAHAGAMALLQDADPKAAAREALPDADRGATIDVHGRRVTITLDPPAPLHALLPRLQAYATADAGPEAAP